MLFRLRRGTATPYVRRSWAWGDIQPDAHRLSVLEPEEDASGVDMVGGKTVEGVAWKGVLPERGPNHGVPFDAGRQHHRSHTLCATMSTSDDGGIRSPEIEGPAGVPIGMADVAPCTDPQHPQWQGTLGAGSPPDDPEHDDVREPATDGQPHQRSAPESEEPVPAPPPDGPGSSRVDGCGEHMPRIRRQEDRSMAIHRATCGESEPHESIRIRTL